MNTENNSELFFWIIGVPVIFLVIVLIISVIIKSSDTSYRLNKIDEAINKEINNFLLQKNDINYIFKSEELELRMKSELRTAIIDLRCNRTEFNRAYIYRSETKIKQIYRIINKYYILDKKIIIEISNDEIDNDNSPIKRLN